MNGPWCSSESALRGTQNTCASLSCHLPDLAFLGEQPSYSFQCLSSRNHPEMLRWCSLHLFLHVLESTRCPFPRLLKGRHLDVTLTHDKVPLVFTGFALCCFPFYDDFFISIRLSKWKTKKPKLLYCLSFW